jgi:DNA-binding Xre family transcriptional regulator
VTIEDELKEYILSRYKSLREFSEFASLPNSTVNTILNRGVSNAKVGNVIQICKALNISTDALADGKIEPKLDYCKPMLDVKDIVDDTKLKLAHAVTIDGKNIDIEMLDPISEALEIGYEMTKKRTTSKNSNTKK